MIEKGKGHRPSAWRFAAGWVLVAAALAGMTGGCAWQPAAPGGDPAAVHGRLIRDVHSDYSHIRVRAKGSLRSLFFVEPPGLEVRQTAMNLRRPGFLVVTYPRYLFTSLLVREPTERVLVVGLGGGAMVRFLNEHFPELGVDAVEIDPVVVTIAEEVFKTRPSATTRIFEEDAFVFLKRVPEKYDVIYMDAFLEPGSDTDGKGVPRKLKTVRFLRSLHARLTPQGIVAFNLVEGEDTREDLEAIRAAFSTVYVFRAPDTDNVAVIASLERSRLSRRELAARGRALDGRLRAGFSFEGLVEALEE